jgi:hypothetical protein
VIPRYSSARRWQDIDFTDAGWPGAPNLGSAIQLPPEQIDLMVAELSACFG